MPPWDWSKVDWGDVAIHAGITFTILVATWLAMYLVYNKYAAFSGVIVVGILTLNVFYLREVLQRNLPSPERWNPRNWGPGARAELYAPMIVSGFIIFIAMIVVAT